MKIRSYESLDFPLAWKRVLTWVSEGQPDIQDRLPYEVLKRMYSGRGPWVNPQTHLQPINLVFAPKKSATSRPLVRLSPRDLLLYQALVDRLAPDIEAALPPRDVVFAYRQTLGRQHNAFAGSPSREDYATRAEDLFFFRHGVQFGLSGDVAGFFLHIEIDELERQLLTASRQSNVVRDLTDLLRGWAALGLKGLPQGIRASSPLGNLYLAPLDELLLSQGIQYLRWMDDWMVAASGFHEARRIQDEMERRLYDLGLTLAADKTQIVGWFTASSEGKGARQQLAEVKDAELTRAKAWVAEQVAITGYPPSEDEIPDPAKVNREVVRTEFDRLFGMAEGEARVPKEAHSMGVAVFREMESLKEPVHIEKLPRLLMRIPSLTRPALDYLATVARKSMKDAAGVYEELLSSGRFMSDVEKLNLCYSILKLPEGKAVGLAPSLAGWARDEPSDLVRARALLAWGAQSPRNDFGAADLFWHRATAPWQPYALLAIQRKSKQQRDARYARWGGEARFSGELAAEVKKSPFAWRKL